MLFHKFCQSIGVKLTMPRRRYLWCWQLNLMILFITGMSVTFFRNIAMAEFLPDSSLVAESSGLTSPQVNLNNQSADTKDRTITIKRFEFEGNTAFTDEELNKVTKPYKGRPLTFEELLDVESQLAQHYIDHGFIGSGAFIPSTQIFSLSDAVVKIQVVEGVLLKINIEGTQRITRDYIRFRLQPIFEAPAPLHERQIINQLRHLKKSLLFKRCGSCIRSWR